MELQWIQTGSSAESRPARDSRIGESESGCRGRWQASCPPHSPRRGWGCGSDPPAAPAPAVRSTCGCLRTCCSTSCRSIEARSPRRTALRVHGDGRGPSAAGDAKPGLLEPRRSPWDGQCVQSILVTGQPVGRLLRRSPGRTEKDSRGWRTAGGAGRGRIPHRGERDVGTRVILSVRVTGASTASRTREERPAPSRSGPIPGRGSSLRDSFQMAGTSSSTCRRIPPVSRLGGWPGHSEASGRCPCGRVRAGRLFYARSARTSYARPFDAERLEFSGAEVQVAAAGAMFSVSHLRGSLVYRPEHVSTSRLKMMFDRDGQRHGHGRRGGAVSAASCSRPEAVVQSSCGATLRPVICGTRISRPASSRG